MNIGILISPNPELSQQPLRKQLPEPIFYERLHEEASQLNITLYVFNANGFKRNGNFLVGYRFINDSWIKSKVDFPNIIIDRTFHPSLLHAHTHSRFIKLLEACQPFLYLNSQLPHKLIVYDMLQAKFSSYIPPTIAYEYFYTLEKWLDQYKKGIILKPQAGMQGKGIIHITKHDDQYTINGRQWNNHPIHAHFSNRLALQKWLVFFKQNSPYLLQPFYSLVTTDDEPFDIRVLMQKDGKGFWQYSGDIARVGVKKNLTSNLHGGGQSLPSLDILNNRFTEHKAIALLEEIRVISHKIVEELESCLGRFGELALDYGVTENGQIILLECNSKPGRQAFNLNYSLQNKVLQQPLLYAQYLFEHYVRNKNKIYSSTSNHH